MRHWKRITNEDAHGLFRFFNTKNAPKYLNFYLATQMEHMISPVIFAGALMTFAGALLPWAPA